MNSKFPNSWKEYTIPITLFFLTWIIYINSIENQLLPNWYDGYLLKENSHFLKFEPTHLINLITSQNNPFNLYIPITILFTSLEYTLWKLNTTGYHAINISLHALNGILLFTLIKQHLKKSFPALIATLFFLFHPIQVENVVWISQQKNILGLFFLLTAVITHSTDHKNANFLSLILFTASTLSTPLAASTFLIFLAQDHLYSKFPFHKLILRNFPFIAIGISTIILTISNYESNNTLPLLKRLSLTPWIIWDYTTTLIAPLNLNNLYLYDPTQINPTNPQIWLGCLSILALTIPIFYSSNKLILLSLVWVWTTSIPILNLLPLAIQRADRYMYFPSIGICLLLGIMLDQFHQHTKQQTIKIAITTIVTTLIIGCAFLTIKQNNIWENSGTLWQNHLQDYPHSEIGLLNQGIHHFDNNNPALAKASFTQLATISPQNYLAYRYLGHLSFLENNLLAAKQFYTQAIVLQPQENDISDDLGLVNFQLGLVAFNQENYTLALNYYLEAAKLIPNEPLLHNNIGFTFYILKDYEKALIGFQTATQLNPNYTKAWINMGNAALSTGNYQLTKKAYFKALELNAKLGSHEASNLCLALAELQEKQDLTLKLCEWALEIEPQNGLFWGRYAHVLLLLNQPERAFYAASNAIKTAPHLSLGYRTQGDALSQLGYTKEAITAYQNALTIDPNNLSAQEGLSTLTP